MFVVPCLLEMYGVDAKWWPVLWESEVDEGRVDLGDREEHLRRDLEHDPRPE